MMSSSVVQRPKCSDLLQTMFEWRINREELNTFIQTYEMPEGNEFLLEMFNTFEN